jgi:serine/threonine-protein kinase
MNSPDDYPSAAVLAALEEMARNPLPPERHGAEAWKLLARAMGNDDFPVVLDFALENELILPLDGRGGRAQTWVNPIDGSEMVWIPPGPFLATRQRQRASCPGFSLARYPVTNAQFRQFLVETRYVPPAEHPDLDRYLAHWIDGDVPAGLEWHPVVWVSFVDVLAYCRWAGLTLPGEWQWEKAACGPEGRMFPWGDARPYRWRKEPLAHVRAEATCAVGLFSRTRSPYGCEELVGNVSEWCQMMPEGAWDRFPPAYPEVPLPPGLEPVYTVVRGACFLRTDAKNMAAYHRRRLAVTRRNRWVGFRPALLYPHRPVGEAKAVSPPAGEPPAPPPQPRRRPAPPPPPPGSPEDEIPF